nr:sigma-54 dependent transcriptional regulator [Dissulfurirhabdus thermomarina]
MVLAPGPRERLLLQEHLEATGHEVSAAPDLAAASALLERGEHDAALVWHEAGVQDGLAALEALAGRGGGRAPILLAAARAAIEDAVAAMRLGAADVMTPPFAPDTLALALARAVETTGRTPGAAGAPPEAPAPAGAPRRAEDRHRLLTASPAMEAILARARSVAPSRAAVLIQGESGTGKELLARYIHRHSDRAGGPFVAVNCAALPETLLESELFGHEKGAFSGAVRRKAGRFEQADGGTILLDEITEMAPTLQAKLLRVLQEGEVDRLGGTAPVPVDVRVISTTNREILAAVRKGDFREDLYFRLNVIPFRVPALRERPEDIPFLAEHYRARFCAEYRRGELAFAEGVLEELARRPWAGNVRELRNVVERGVLLAQDSHITLADLLADEAEAGLPGPEPAGDTVLKLDEMEKAMIQKALARTQGNRTHAAKLLGISVRTLRNKLADYRRAGLVL